VQWRSRRTRHAQRVAHALLSCEPSSSSLLLIVLPPPAATSADDTDAAAAAALHSGQCHVAVAIAPRRRVADAIRRPGSRLGKRPVRRSLLEVRLVACLFFNRMCAGLSKISVL
jgi:hypothetical protein